MSVMKQQNKRNSMTKQDAVLLQDAAVIRAMRKYGGSFAAALGHAAVCADDSNLQRIKDAFPEMWVRYSELSEHYSHATK